MLRADENPLISLEEIWASVHLQTSWKLQPCLNQSEASTEANAVSWSATTIAISDTEVNDTLVHVQDTSVQRVTAKVTHGSQNSLNPLIPSNSTSGPTPSSLWEVQTLWESPAE